MYGHPDIDRYVISTRQSALLSEANEARLANLSNTTREHTQIGRSLRQRLVDLLRRTEPDFACVEPDCSPVRP